jgi:hypothetical protein
MTENNDNRNRHVEGGISIRLVIGVVIGMFMNIVMGIAIGLATLLSGRASMTDAACSASLLAFATVEHVNYSAWQLMHDNVNDLRYLRRHRRLRRAPLAEDLRRSSRMPPGNRRIFRRSLAEAFSETELRALGLLGNPRYFGASSTWVEAS